MYSIKQLLSKDFSMDSMCLSRFEWLQQLYNIFTTATNSNEKITSDIVIQSLHKLCNSGSISLEYIENYSKPTDYYTKAHILQRISSIEGTITWDKLFDAVTSKTLVLKKAKRIKLYPAITSENCLSISNTDIAELSGPLLYLNISSNKLQDLPKLPESLKILNVSNNALGKLEIPCNTEYVNANNNEITAIFFQKHCLTEELYLSNNKLDQIDGIHRLMQLNMLDISGNLIEHYEDLAVLSLNSNLRSVSLKDNPIYLMLDFSISELLPTVQHSDSDSIIANSRCPHTEILFNQSTQTQKRVYTLPLNFSEIVSARQPCKPNTRTSNQNSRASSPSLYTSNFSNKSVCYNSSPLYKENIAEKRQLNSSQRRSSSTLITPENIAQATKVKYGNPIAALMIKPGNKRRLHRRK